MPTAPETLPDLPDDRPVRTMDQDVFDAAWADFLVFFFLFYPQFGEELQRVYDNSLEAYNNAQSAITKAAEALASANAAAASSASALAAPGSNGTSATSRTIPSSTGVPVAMSFVTEQGKAWVNQTLKLSSSAQPGCFIILDNISYTSGTGALSGIVTFAQGAGTYADWKVSVHPKPMVPVVNAVQKKDAGFTAYKYNKGSDFYCTVAMTVAFDAAATLDADWYCFIENGHASGAVILDPLGSETVSGLSTLTVHPGEKYEVYVGDIGTGLVLLAKKISGARPYLKVSDQKVSGTDGGSSVASDITQTRTLNTTDANTIAGASLSSDQITLPAGTYTCRIRVPFASNTRPKAFLYNTSDSTYTLIGSNLGSTTAGAGGDSLISGRFTITSAKNFKIRYFANGAVASSGLGQSISSGQVEVYTEAEFWREGNA